MILMQPEWLDNDVICPNNASQASNKFGAEERGVVGELDAVAAAALKNLQGKAIIPGVGDEDTIALPQAQVVSHLVRTGAQDDGDHMQILAGIDLCRGQDVGRNCSEWWQVGI